MFKKALEEYNYDKKIYIKKIKEEKNIRKKIKLMIPNILTKSRILAPFLLLPSALIGNFVISTIIASILGLTDFFDGLLARKWNATSKYGQKLDAISDKLFAIGISLPILISNPLSIISTIILEVIIGSINANSYLKGNNPKSTLLGKFKTTILYVFLASTYLVKALNFPLSLFVLTCGTNVLQLSTAIQYYMIDNKKEKKKKENIIEKIEKLKTDDEDLSISSYRKQIEELKTLKESLIQSEVEEKEKTYTKTPRK